MKRRHLTDEQIRKLPRKTKRYTVADPELIGHYMRVSNGVPKFLRLKNLEELGIAKTHQAVRHMQIHCGFPLGRLLGPGTRVWTEDEINEWLASRPVEVSEQARRRAQKSIEARRKSNKAA